MQKITTLVVVSSAHEILFRRYFKPTLPNGLRLDVFEMRPNRTEGIYMSEEWQEAMCAKVRHALDFCLRSPDGEPFIVSDVDVQFFPSFDTGRFLEYADSLGCDLSFQRERFREGDTEANCGFYTGRNTAAVRKLLCSVLENLQADSIKNEQNAVNRMLKQLGIPYATLDGRFYARTHGFPPPQGIWMHHASWTKTISEKIRQLDRVRRIAQGGMIRLQAEAYMEHLSRPPGHRRGLGWFLGATREYSSRFPIKPCQLP